MPSEVKLLLATGLTTGSEAAPARGNAQGAMSTSATGVAAITTSDSAADNVTQPYRGFMIGVAGNVAVVCPDGTSGTLTGCLVGVQYAVEFVRIATTGTSATGIVGLK